MKKKFFITIILPLLGMFSCQVANAQSTRIIFGEDTVSTIDKYDRLYHMVAAEKVDRNTLLKFDAVMWGQKQPSVTVEQRVWKDIIIEPNLAFSSFDWSRDQGINFALKPTVDLKYYYNRTHREGLGREVVGFSADYIGFGFSYTFTDDKLFYGFELGDHYIELPEGELLPDRDFYTYYSWHVVYGIQRRIGKMAYADVSGGFEKTYFGAQGNSKVLPIINIRLGIAFSTGQFKRMLR